MQESQGNHSEGWSALQYVKFEKERNRPVADLLAHLPSGQVNKAADIGCGPGNSTELLKAKYPDAEIKGMDSSPNMIGAARKRIPDVRFEVDDISTWQDKGPYDIILSNAVLQWVPDHEILFPALMNKLNPGGSLAVQMPDNLEEPAQILMRTVAAEGPWANKLSGSSKRVARQSAAWYYQVLKNSTTVLDIWKTTYYHQLAGGAAAIVEWFKGTGLRPYLDPLDENEQAAFLEKYLSEIKSAYPENEDGTVLLPFPRLFIIATR
ncbi:MAG TPA: trans-aconitate 2-methyltransferase [Pedobacter sp.]